ncbi:hypothetical protein ACOME3_010393 [Neoechinorhynchus agilis]
MSSNDEKTKRQLNSVWRDVLEREAVENTTNRMDLLKVSVRHATWKDYDNLPRFQDFNVHDNRPIVSYSDLRCKNKGNFQQKQLLCKKIIDELNEPNHSLIERCVRFGGVKVCEKLLAKTNEIQEKGGMLTINKSRQRTPGGVFLFLMSNTKRISQKARTKIFANDDLKMNGNNANKSSQNSADSEIERLALSRFDIGDIADANTRDSGEEMEVDSPDE